MPFWASIGPSATSQIRSRETFLKVRRVLDVLYPFINDQFRLHSGGLDPTLVRELGGIGLPALNWSLYAKPRYGGDLGRGIRTLLFATNPLDKKNPSGDWSFAAHSERSDAYKSEILEQINFVRNNSKGA